MYLLFNIIGFACLGIVVSMQMAHANQWIFDQIEMYLIPYPLRCNKCLTFWSCLIFNLTTVNPINAILTAAIAAILSIVIYNRL
jgi:hypothetical protein